MEHLNTHSTILICGAPRSGTNYLCDFLGRTGVAGRPAEYMSRKFASTASGADFVAEIMKLGTTPNGVFSSKVFWHHLEEFRLRTSGQRGPVDASEAAAMITATFPNPQLVYLSRRDTLRQAISYWRADLSDIWWRKSHPASPPLLPTFDYEEIRRLRDLFERWDLCWLAVFGQMKLPVLRIEFDDLFENIKPIVAQICALVGETGLVVDPARPNFLQQSDADTDLIVSQYLATERDQA
jgi:trehalose 2-sulfotransferase